MDGMYRGKTSEGKEVFGWLTERYSESSAYSKAGFYIEWFGDEGSYYRSKEVTFASLAQFTGKHDKNGKPIYGSFWIDGKLTGGGDWLKHKHLRIEVLWDNMFLRWMAKEHTTKDFTSLWKWDIENKFEIIEGGE